MVNLPKPSAFSSSGRIDILPRTHLPSQLPPPSTQPCSYRFGLAALPQEAEASLDKDLLALLNRLLALSQQLAIPTLFASGDGQAWTHSEQHYPALLAWKEQQVPLLLAQVEQLLQDLSSIGAGSCDEAVHLVLGQVVCAVTRYLPLGDTAVDSEPISHADGWTSEGSSTQAKSVLSTFHQLTTLQDLPILSTLAKGLFTDYIKPIFRETASSSSASTSSIDPNTGRKTTPAAGSNFISHLDARLGQHRFQSADQDNDASNLAPQPFAPQPSPEVLPPNGTAVVERNEAVGCVNVFAWCLDGLVLDEGSDWDEVWPLVVPPLLTLLEHAQPRFRARGSAVVHRLLCKPGEVERRQAVLGQLLIRTGIGSLLERALQVNLTYIHDEHYAPELLSHSIAALRRLILLTTQPIVFCDAQHHVDDSAVEGDGGELRMQALSALISQGVLSTWSYLPLPPSRTHLGRSLVDVSCTAYMQLIDDLSPHPSTIGGVARFLDVSLDWICRSWLAHVEFDHTAHVRSTTIVLRLARRFLVAPARRFTGMLLAALAKCFVSARESHLRSKGGGEWNEMEECLSTLLRHVASMDPTVQARWSELVDLDPQLAVLLPPQ